jgi:hypothetical protein
LQNVRRKACVPDANTPYSVANYAQSPADKTRFYISPPLPSTTPPTIAFVEITCSGVRPFAKTDQLPIALAYHVPLMHYALYLSYMLDDESISSARRAAEHKAEFYSLVGKRIILEDKRKKEEATMP